MSPRREVRISQSAYARLLEALQWAELSGHHPDVCAAHALMSIGLDAVPGVETVLVVDPHLDGPIFPFMEWPAELLAERAQ